MVTEPKQVINNINDIVANNILITTINDCWKFLAAYDITWKWHFLIHCSWTVNLFCEKKK